MLPKTFLVSSCVDIATPAPTLFGIVSNIHRFNEWSPWAKYDPEVQYTREGIPGMVGSSFSWQGNKKVGQGTMKVLSISSPNSVTVHVKFLAPFKSESVVTWTIENLNNNQSKFTWDMTGELNSFFQKIFSFVMRPALKKDFNVGLANLKKIAE